MRLAAAIVFGTGLFVLASALGSAAHAEYYCSEGFEPSYGGRCVATAARDEVHLYVNDPAEVYPAAPRPLIKHRRHRLHARY